MNTFFKLCTFRAFCSTPEKCLLADRCLAADAEIMQNLRRIRIEEGRSTAQEALDWINHECQKALDANGNPVAAPDLLYVPRPVGRTIRLLSATPDDVL